MELRSARIAAIGINFRSRQICRIIIDALFGGDQAGVMNFVVGGKRKSSNKEVITILAIECVEIPQNCHECDSIGISDLVGLICPGASGSYSFDNRPEGCPLKEVESMHTADEAVVRCRDCVYCEYDRVFIDRLWCKGHVVKEDHPCGHGVRKEDDIYYCDKG